MAESIVSNVVATVLEYLGLFAAEKIAPFLGGRDKLDELHQTMRMIQARLADAERQHEGERGDLIKEWLKGLKGVMYRFEDLLEEIADGEIIKSRHSSATKLNKLVCYLPSMLSSLRINKTVIEEVNSITSQLNRLKDDMSSLRLEEAPQPTVNLIDTRETHSFVREDKIIGRNKDKDVIIGMLLNSYHVKEALLVVPIVGMGGLGKTALAQFVFNDQRVQQHFQFKFWTCISDKISGRKELIGKVLQSMTTKNDEWHKWSLENLQSELRQVLKEKQFLLVLDDVWDENKDWWTELGDLLCEGKSGGAIVVTTRSEVVASNMGTVKPYKLQGLTEDQSWTLFRSLAFKEGQEERYPNLASIGRDILKKCGNIPLSIKAISGLLYSRGTEEEWVQFRDREIAMLNQKENDIMWTLNLSYYHLPPKLKQCFAYCSLYPKDFEFDIQDLIFHWLAQGYISSMDDGHACFLELLRRCFFQEVTTDECGVMVDCKMHDLMHDLAQNAGDECLIVDKPMGNINSNVRHVAIIIDEEDSLSPLEAPWLLTSRPIRTLHLPFGRILDLNVICLHFRQLRVLDLGRKKYENLPNSIRKVKHLRYLKVNVDRLPEGIVRLQNLQTLDVAFGRLEELPRDFTKLTSLRHMVCPFSLLDMPPGFGQLEHLETLNTFIVGANNGLEALSRMNLTGELQIHFKANRQNAISEGMTANLKAKKLIHLTLFWQSPEEQSGTEDDELLNCLSFPTTLKGLDVKSFRGVRLSWGMYQFPNIVNISIIYCMELRYLPCFGRLPHLKMLTLWGLHALEYVDVGSGNIGDIVSSSSSPEAALSSTTMYFPSLETLTLHGMPNLQQWFGIEDSDIHKQMQQYHQHFPSLLRLYMQGCRKLMSLPWSIFVAHNFRMPLILENMEISGCEELELLTEHSNHEDSNNIKFSMWQSLTNLHSLKLESISKLESLPSGIAALTQLQSLEFSMMNNLKTLTEGIGQLTQLRSLSIKCCPQLESLPKSFRSLTAMQKLEVWVCPQLTRRLKEPDGEDWPLIQHITHKDISDEE